MMMPMELVMIIPTELALVTRHGNAEGIIQKESVSMAR